MRLLTRPDFDGLACAAILKDIEVIDTYKFVHPDELCDGTVEVGAGDVLANVPYVSGCGLWFDHHTSGREKLSGMKFDGLAQYIDSAAHVVYNYYKGAGRDLSKFDGLVAAVDKVDAARLSADEVANPKDWVLLGFLMDPRTGLGRCRDYSVSGRSLMDTLVGACGMMGIAEILAIPGVAERVDLYHRQNVLFVDMLKNNTVTDRNVIVTDLRGVSPVYSGNRFLLYCLFPDQNVSVWAADGKDGGSCVFTAGHSIFNRTNTKDIGAVMLGYGGEGRRHAGTCKAPREEADRVLSELREKLQ